MHGQIHIFAPTNAMNMGLFSKKEQSITTSSNLEAYFAPFREQIIGIDHSFLTPSGEKKKVHYFDWTASGRMYAHIEERMVKDILPFVANTHTDTNYTGSLMTSTYHEAQKKIKKHVNAGERDVLISSNSGMTGVVNKFQRILGLKVHESFNISLDENERPIVFISHMEHHSNQTTWLETLADVVVVPANEEGLVCKENFRTEIAKYPNRKIKIVSITACSNVTGIETPYMDIAEIIHTAGGYCFADFACSGPYVEINMHEDDSKGRYLDAIFLSPHKFLGGPGTTGILIFNDELYNNAVPDNPGGGTVDWTNPWGEHKYLDNIEAREDGGTPSFLQTMRVALCMDLKEQMGTDNIRQREHEILELIFNRLDQVPNLTVLADQHKNRLGVISFYIHDLHYNLGVKILNDRFGIQTRGGCSCAGTYGHYLLNVDKEYSKSITDEINQGNLERKPGWIRMSIHPTHTNEEVNYALDAIEALSENWKTWSEDYNLNLCKGYIAHKNEAYDKTITEKAKQLLSL